MVIGYLLRRAAAEEPDAIAYVHGDQRLTYSDWDRAADRAAARLWNEGVRPGDVVGLLLDPSFAYPIAYVAISRLGCVTAGINPRFGPREVEHIVSSSGAPVVVSNREVPGAAQVLPPDALDADDEPPDAEAGFEEPITIVYTSGTTGLPKGATFRISALEAVRRIEATVEPRLTHTSGLQATPMTHMGYMTKIASHIERRAKTVLMTDRWTAHTALELIERERITHIGGVPTQLALMMMDPEFKRFDLSSVRSILIGGAPASPDLVRQIRETFGVPVQHRYSSTELALCCSTRPGDPDVTVADTVGRALPEVELRILEPNQDGIGEVVARSPAMMRGYWNDPDATREAVDEEGYFHPGDLGRIDEDGNLRLAGRTKEMYIRGGYNVYPVEVENVLREHLKVALVGVIGFPDEVLGERGKAFVVPADASDPPTAEELKAFVADRIADYKTPDVVEIRAELPLTSMFKVDKAALSDEPS
ncbi:MAG: class I adenylate-forming enzyme family protein [Actinomycetota bacterium]